MASRSETFWVPVEVRGYETDTQGHLNQSVYLQYAEHARWSLLRAAGIGQRELVAGGLGPVVLETTLKYRHELVAGDRTEVSCAFVWTGRKVFELEQCVRKADGTVATEVTAKGGLLDLERRRLVDDPEGALRRLATRPGVLGVEE
ncbi:acyl-CoA thioesterase [Streptomyces xiaopingdaonensis]|uniref:acyl-CoA thioesterase n=1 Tax=Streptomyces xiaopingdaonensis TaxID=1565415 RepID=UPI0002FA2F1C|nr:acyl-CoA thioesterase [Streptomyces xiaopingdaonensis]